MLLTTKQLNFVANLEKRALSGSAKQKLKRENHVGATHVFCVIIFTKKQEEGDGDQKKLVTPCQFFVFIIGPEL